MNNFSWAPVFTSYGSNNRTNSFHIQNDGGHCKSRNVDGSVNLYLDIWLRHLHSLQVWKESVNNLIQVNQTKITYMS
ncbi:hypothetical protein [Acinetobacter thermotolerans]|uniref:hypothetical protein n=1 Tax=Acinetobacter thermotolerans TaxID=3151487 RepID=UPI0038513568